MKIHRLIIKNFMPYKGDQEIQFPTHATQNVMLLFGDNMRGKTSFLNAIRWVFYGVALARHLRVIPLANLVNVDAAEDGDWSMSVAIYFSHDGRDYEVRRQIEKHLNVLEPRVNADFKEDLGLKINGEAIPVDRFLFEINQVVPQEISRFFLFDGELLQEYENLLIDESEQGKKIKLHIEQALGVPALINARVELDQLLKEARAQQSKEAKKDTELKAHAEELKNLEFRLEMLDKDKGDLDIQRVKIKRELEDIDDYLQNTEALQKKAETIASLKAQKVALVDRIKETEEENRLLLKTAWKDILAEGVSKPLSALKNTRDQQQKNIRNRAAIENKILGIESTIEDDSLCITCGQQVPDHAKESLRGQLSSLRSQLNDIKGDVDQLGELTTRIDNLAAISSKGECRSIVDNLAKITKMNIDLTSIENDLDDLDKEIQAHDTDQIMRQREKRRLLEKQFGRIESDIEKLNIEIDENNKKQEHISNIIIRSKGSKGMLSSKRVSVYQDLQTIFKMGIDHLRDNLREQVSISATNTFKQLTTESTYSGLEINNNYGLSIKDHENRVVKERSAGAEQIVALSLIDGLKKTSQKSGPIIMDTPFGRLDPRHRSKVLSFLPNMAEQVVLLVHGGEINPDKDLQEIASRIGATYKIRRLSATQSRIEKGV